MLKKVFKIGMLAGLIAMACTANAQEEKHYWPQYPQYGFWSNWSIGGEVLYNMQYGNFGGPQYWRSATNLGGSLFVEKELNYVWDMRLSATVSGFFHRQRKSDRLYDPFGKIMVDFKFSLNNAFRGHYDPECRHNWYLVMGLGGAANAGSRTESAIANGYSRMAFDQDFGWIGWTLDAGIGYSLQVCEHGTFFVEYVHDITANPRNFINSTLKNEDNRALGWQNMTGNLAIGFMYNFGPTQADLDLIAQRALLTQENFDKMSDEIDGLRKDLADAKTREAKLINRINELEAQQNDGNTQIVKTDDGVADSLRKVIEGYENNKHNFYALPFSITYGVDQYTVSDDQMNKINAIAKLMKDNEDINFEIIGYCDYSGSDEYNQKLSEKRAEYVKKLLVRRGVAEDRLTTSGKGKSLPFGDIKNSINRRVSFYRSNN